MVSAKTTFLIVAILAILVIIIFVFLNLVSAGSSSNDTRKHKHGKHKNKPAEVIQAADLKSPSSVSPPQPDALAKQLKTQSSAQTQSSPYRNAYPLNNDYRLTATGALVSALSIAVTSNGTVFCIDTTNDLLFSTDTGKTFQKVYLAPRDVAVDMLIDLAYDSTLDTLSILRNEVIDQRTNTSRQRIDTFAVDSLLQSSSQYPVKSRWMSHAQQPDGSSEVAALVRQSSSDVGGSNKYSSIAYDNDGSLYALYQTDMQQTDVYSLDQKTGVSSFKGPVDSGVLKLMFDPRRSDTRYLSSSYCVTNTLFKSDNALALVDNATGQVQPVTEAADQPRGVLKGMYQSIAGNASLLYTVKANRLYHVTQSSH